MKSALESEEKNLPAPPGTSWETVSLAGELLPLCDFISLLLAGYASTLIATAWFPLAGLGAPLWSGIESIALLAAVLAPFILCDRDFALTTGTGQTGALLRCYAIRFAMFVGVVLAVGTASQSLSRLQAGWGAVWLVCSVGLTALTRILLAHYVQRLRSRGRLGQVVAVVGAGPMADRLIQHLGRRHPANTRILGVFEDRLDRSDGIACKPTGTLAQLVELGTRTHIDWIVLCLPGGDARLQDIVHQLKALAAPIGLCPASVGLGFSGQTVDYVGDLFPVTLLADAPPVGLGGAATQGSMRSALFGAMPGAMFAPMPGPGANPAANFSALFAPLLGEFLPRWIVRLLKVPGAALGALRRPRPARLVFTLDDHDVNSFALVAARFGRERFGYVVTPNADHLLRLHQDSSFRALYAGAAFVLLDSRFLSKLWRRLRGVRLPVCTGADLSQKLFDEVIQPDDGVVLLGGSAAQAALLARRYGLRRLAHFNPPMGFIGQPAAVAASLSFIESHSPFRFCFLAVGSPQQEILAHALKARGIARGLALCMGASIDFLTGAERRAPRWLQRHGLEWAFRLLQAPRRMVYRYLVRGPGVFFHMGRTDIALRAVPVTAPAPPALRARTRPGIPRSPQAPAVLSRPQLVAPDLCAWPPPPAAVAATESMRGAGA